MIKIVTWIYELYRITIILVKDVMSCFILLKGITKKITTTAAYFWWDDGENKKGIYWFLWDKVCTHKEERGLNFRDLQDFQYSITSQTVLALIDKPNCLFSKNFMGSKQVSEV